MRISSYYKRCHIHNGQTSFWVEVPYSELNEKIFSQGLHVVTAQNGAKCNSLSTYINNSPLITSMHYFLVSKNVDQIHAFPEHYPYSQLWNAYSPFDKVEPFKIKTLIEIKNVSVGLLKASNK